MKLEFFNKKTKQGRIFLRESLQICKCLVLVQQKKKIVRVTSLGILEPAASRLFSFFRFSSNKNGDTTRYSLPDKKTIDNLSSKAKQGSWTFYFLVIFIFPT